MDLIELNEAFAAQSLGCLKELGIDMGTELYQRVNVNGGAIAHGHALANSGTRLMTTLIYLSLIHIYGNAVSKCIV